MKYISFSNGYGGSHNATIMSSIGNNFILNKKVGKFIVFILLEVYIFLLCIQTRSKKRLQFVKWN